jgi:polyisoprenoid-binding protein YceI
MHLEIASPRRSALAGSCACLFLLAACNTDPGKDQSHAEVSEPAAPVAAQEQAVAAKPSGVTYAFSQADSKVAFVGAKVTGKHDGGFETFSGTIQLVDGDPEKSTVAVEIDNASITTDTAKLTTHLKSPDFFDVARHPKTRFTSTQIKAGGEDGASHTVTGNLELHGVTKAITFPATIRASGERVEVDADFAINRHDFGIVYAGMPDDLIKDNVLIKLELRAGKSPQS